MGDRTAFQCTIDACPEDQREAVREILDEYADHIDWTRRLPRELAMGQPYTAHEVSCGTAQEIAGSLVDAAPGVSFTLWEDPAYQWLGDVYAHTPELGMFHAECDANGNPVYSPAQVADMIREATSRVPGISAADLATEVGKAMGGPWFASPVAAATPDYTACGQADETGEDETR